MTGCFSELNQHILPLISGYIFCRVFLVLAQGLYFWSEVTRKLTTQLKSATLKPITTKSNMQQEQAKTMKTVNFNADEDEKV